MVLVRMIVNKLFTCWIGFAITNNLMIRDNMKKIVFIFLTVVGLGDAKSQTSIDNVILLFGDSITATRLHNPNPQIGNVNGANVGATVKRLEALLNESNRETIVLNYGWSGTTTEIGLDRIEANIAAAKQNHPGANYYIGILYGTNDFDVGGIQPSQTQDNMQGMIDVARANDVTPVVGTILPRLDRDVLIYNQAIKIAASNRNALLVDHNLAWKSNIDLLSEDGLHPTLEGYEFIGDIWFEAFRGIIPEGKPLVITPIIMMLLQEDE